MLLGRLSQRAVRAAVLTSGAVLTPPPSQRRPRSAALAAAAALATAGLLLSPPGQLSCGARDAAAAVGAIVAVARAGAAELRAGAAREADAEQLPGTALPYRVVL